jgi:hypothetical protein
MINELRSADDVKGRGRDLIEAPNPAFAWRKAEEEMGEGETSKSDTVVAHSNLCPLLQINSFEPPENHCHFSLLSVLQTPLHPVLLFVIFTFFVMPKMTP